MLNTVISNLITKSVHRDGVGVALGLSAPLESLARVLAPALGGFLIQLAGTCALGVVAGGLTAWLAA